MKLYKSKKIQLIMGRKKIVNTHKFRPDVLEEINGLSNEAMGRICDSLNVQAQTITANFKSDAPIIYTIVWLEALQKELGKDSIYDLIETV